MSFSTATESSADVWARGVELLDNGDLVRASDCFEHLLEYDPHAADAWLGIHACGGEQRNEAVLRMLEHQGNLGRLRAATGLRLESTYAIGMFAALTLTDAQDVWMAYVALLIEGEQFENAGEALTEMGHVKDDRIRFLRTRYYFNQGGWEQVLDAAHGIQDPVLRDEARLYVAQSLIHLENPTEALQVAEGLPAVIADPGYDAYVSFVRGSALGALGKAEESAQAFQRAYRLAPDNELFAEYAMPKAGAGAKGGAAERAADERAKLLEKAGRELDAMIGLNPVKEQIQILKAQFRMAALKKERGLKTSTRPQHFVFTGPPGTGKTTVARIMGQILAGLGLLEHGRVVEAQRGDLVGEYLGQTAIKTREKIDEASGGVLFIDEAYSLSNQGYAGSADAFGEEATQEILTAAENRRDRLVIVLAGYTEEIDELLSTNPGLKSRFSTVIEFPSYSAEELAAIAVSILNAAGETLTAEAERSLWAGCEIVVGSGRIDELGNGRFARELSHKTAAQRDLRLLGHYGDSGTPTSEEMTTIEAVDFANAFEEFTT
jgi:tetratricopeptide (TPR) repeat protein